MSLTTDQDLYQLAESVGQWLSERQLFLVTAESCTGGWAGKVITDVPGSSHWYDRGFITYTNQAKQQQLGIPSDLIEKHGAVSQQIAEAMVAGALANSNAAVALAITGIAGPGGGSEDKPVGLVWFAWAMNGKQVQAAQQHFKGDRERIRRQAVGYGLAQLMVRFTESP